MIIILVIHTVDIILQIGNGDVLGYEDYYHHIEKDRIDGVMIGRGALV